MVKKRKFKEMGVEELKKQLEELKTELFKERGSKATTGRPSNPGKYRQSRKIFALIKTLLNQRGQKT